MERSYQTKQRSRILEYLKDNKDKHITAETIIEHFKRIGSPVGKATVYRYLDSLVEENVIRRYITPENSTAACYQYIDDENNCKCHYHMKCTKCGLLIHLNCEEIDELSNHIFEEHKFKLDECKTILYGTCAKCLEK